MKITAAIGFILLTFSSHVLAWGVGDVDWKYTYDYLLTQEAYNEPYHQCHLAESMFMDGVDYIRDDGGDLDDFREQIQTFITEQNVRADSGTLAFYAVRVLYSEEHGMAEHMEIDTDLIKQAANDMCSGMIMVSKGMDSWRFAIMEDDKMYGR